jgi:hypothetical protein
MDIQTRKITFVQEFLRLQNEEIISGLENLLRKKKAEQFENELKPMSLNEFNEQIDKSLDDSSNGKVIKAEDLKEKIKKWG